MNEAQLFIGCFLLAEIVFGTGFFFGRIGRR